MCNIKTNVLLVESLKLYPWNHCATTTNVHGMCCFQIRTHVDPQTGCTIAYTPHGRFIHIPPPCPSSDWSNDFGRAWWRDDCYCIGTLSKKTRFIRVINTLTSQEQVIEVWHFVVMSIRDVCGLNLGRKCWSIEPWHMSCNCTGLFCTWAKNSHLPHIPPVSWFCQKCVCLGEGMGKLWLRTILSV